MCDTQTLLRKIEAILIAEIPPAIKAAKISEPMYCLRIWYSGPDSFSDAIPYCMLVKESVRRGHAMNDGLMYDEAIWLADELTYTEMSQDVHITNSELNPLYRTWHDWLCNHDGEDTGMEQLRKMVQRVSQRLNQMNWKLFLPVTDDFVVFPADGSHTFYDDIGDLLSSITPAQESMLRSRNMIREE